LQEQNLAAPIREFEIKSSTEKKFRLKSISIEIFTQNVITTAPIFFFTYNPYLWILFYSRLFHLIEISVAYLYDMVHGLNVPVGADYSNPIAILTRAAFPQLTHAK